MMDPWKKVLCTALIVSLLAGLCACGGKSGEDETTVPVLDGDLPEAILGSWYLHPEVCDTPIEIYPDNTCVIREQQSQARLETVTENYVILTAGSEGEYYFDFQRLQSSMPILLTGDMGYAVQDPELWNYMIEWYCPENGNAFTLVFEELIQTECELRMENGCLSIEARDGDTITHTVVISGDQAVVTDAEGNSQVFFPIDGGGSGITDGDGPEARYYQAVTDLQTVISGGEMVDFVDSEGKKHLISGADAMEKLYHTFTELQRYMDASEHLNMIQKNDGVLLNRNIIDFAGNVTPVEFKYNCFGEGNAIYEKDAIALGAYEFYGYDLAGNIKSLTVCGMVSGRPVFDETGRVVALEVWSFDREQYYTAPVTLDDHGRIIRVEVPFVDYEDTSETDYKEVYELLYGDDGKLIQYSDTKYSYAGTYETTDFYQRDGFYDKMVVECYYDSDGNMEKAIEHWTYTATNGMSSWSYFVTEYEYEVQGKPSLYKTSFCSISYSIPNTVGTPREEIERMESIHWWLFHSNGFINSVGKDLTGQTEGHMHDFHESSSVEYEYGSIYIYNPSLDNSEGPEERYQQAVEDLQTVLAGGEIIVYQQGGTVGKTLFGAEAMEHLYHVFVSLQRNLDVGEFLDHIQRVDNIQVRSHSQFGGGSVISSKYRYDCYGRQLSIDSVEAAMTGEYLYFAEDSFGNAIKVTVCGLVAGAPVFGENGDVTALMVTSPDTGNVYTAPVTYDDQGRVIRVEVPYHIDIPGADESDFEEIYEFVYDRNGRLVQHTVIWKSHGDLYTDTYYYNEHGFFSKEIVEYYYDQNGRLVQTVIHCSDIMPNGESAWHYDVKDLIYDQDGNLLKQHQVGSYASINKIGVVDDLEEEKRMDRLHNWLFHTDEFVNSKGIDFESQIAGHLAHTADRINVEYEYGSIYIYNPEG